LQVFDVPTARGLRMAEQALTHHIGFEVEIVPADGTRAAVE
jgi:hypothetical protein